MTHHRSKSLLNILSLLALLLALIGGAVTVTPARAAGITVNTTDDELNADGDCSLREAIQAANTDAAVDACSAGSGADIITLPAGTYTLTIPPTGTGAEHTNLDGDLDIMSDLTILGAGATTIIQAGTLGYPDAGANGIGGVIQIAAMGFPALNVTISGVTLANGRNTSFGAGGAILLQAESHLTLTNVLVSGNDASGAGGAIYAFGGTINIDGSTFINNRSQWGGAIYIQSGSTTGVLTITDSSFVNNLASYINGGGALAISGTADISNSTFTNNRAPIHSGGAIYYYGSNLTLTNNTFSGNSAKWGGALHVEGTAHLYNNILANSVSVGDFSSPDVDCHKSSSATIDGTNNLIEMDYYSASEKCGTGTTNLITGQDPLLQPLSASAPYVLLPFPASPAVEAGSNSVCWSAPLNGFDQLGTPRPQGPDCDMGSVELILTPGFSVIESGGSTDVIEGITTDTYAILLNAPPAADVVITPHPDAEVTVNPPSLTFTSANWHTAQTITVSGVSDGIAEALDSGSITHSFITTDPAYIGISPPANINVNITEASFSPNPISLDFGPVAVWSSSSPLWVTITNDGTTPVQLGTLGITGDFLLTAGNNSCNDQLLDPGDTCNFSVTFTPKSAGPLTGQVSIPSSAYAGLSTISLMGVGATPAVGLSEKSIDFGDVLLGSYPTRTLTITNTGLADLYITTIEATGDFGVWNCFFTYLPPGQTCTATVVFYPSVTGPQTGTLSVNTNAASSPDTVALSGNGIQSDLTLSVTSLDFGNQILGTTSAAQTVTLTSSGTAPLHLGVLDITGDFALSANTCENLELPIGGTCTFSVTFTPGALGARTGELTIYSDAGIMESDQLPPDERGTFIPLYPFDVLPLSGNGITSQTTTLTIPASGAYDGTLRESSETSGIANYKEATSPLISIGDDSLKRQYVGILSFDTSAIPDNAVITGVRLKMKAMLISNDVYTVLGELTADVTNPHFGLLPGLETLDFQSRPLARNVGTFSRAPLFYSWINMRMNQTSLFAVNKTGSTQFRLHFTLDDNNDPIKHQLRCLSGNYWTAAARPMLIINYYVP